MAWSSAIAAAEVAVPQATPEWVVFGCDRHRFAIALHRIREILLPRPFTRLPGCGPEVCGLLGLRGRVITVVDLGVALGLRPAATHSNSRLLLLEYGERLVAGAVEEVVAVARVRVRRGALRGSAVRKLGLDRENLLGVGVLDKQSFLALDSDRVLGRLLTK